MESISNKNDTKIPGTTELDVLAIRLVANTLKTIYLPKKTYTIDRSYQFGFRDRKHLIKFDTLWPSFQTETIPTTTDLSYPQVIPAK